MEGEKNYISQEEKNNEEKNMGIREPKMPTPEEMANKQNQNEALEPETVQEKTKTEVPENEKSRNLEKTISLMKEILNVLPNEKYLMDQYGAHLKRGENSSMIEISHLMALRADLTKCSDEFIERRENLYYKTDFSAGIDFPNNNEIDSWTNYLSTRNKTNFFAKQQKFKVHDLLKNLKELSNKLKE